MERVRKQSKLKWFLWSVLVELIAGAIVLAAFMFGSLFTTRADENGLVEIHPKFTLGALDGNGKYQKDVGAIYTKEAFECKGLKIVLDFEDTIFYNICYYKNDGTFISESLLNDENLTAVIPEEATHARIVIIPEWEKLKINDEREQVIKWYEVEKYASQMQLFVLENQSPVKEELNNPSTKEFQLIDFNGNDFRHYDGMYFDMSTGDLLANDMMSAYVYEAKQDCEFYLESDFFDIEFIIVRKTQTSNFVSFNRNYGTFIEGKENTFNLQKGDKVYVIILGSSITETNFYVA